MKPLEVITITGPVRINVLAQWGDGRNSVRVVLPGQVDDGMSGIDAVYTDAALERLRGLAAHRGPALEAAERLRQQIAHLWHPEDSDCPGRGWEQEGSEGDDPCTCHLMQLLDLADEIVRLLK